VTIRAFSRWQAAGLHLLISAATAAVAVAVIVLVWYPAPLFEATRGHRLLVILLGAHLVLGPLLTLIVFKAGKRGMTLDLVVIGLVQFAALGYGCSIAFLGRPAFIVFVKDRFEVITAAELEPDELDAAKYPQFRSPPWTGPMLAAADFPTDPDGRQKVIGAAMRGLDVQNFPRYFVPYAERAGEVLAKAEPIAQLRTTEPEAAKVVDDYLRASGKGEAGVRSLLLRTRYAWVVVLIDPKTAQPVKMLLGENIP
jgi:hypothetical protein